MEIFAKTENSTVTARLGWVTIQLSLAYAPVTFELLDAVHDVLGDTSRADVYSHGSLLASM